MKEDTRNRWKTENLGKLSPAGIKRVAIQPKYKNEAVLSSDGNATTIRCVDGGGCIILVEGTNED